MNSTVRQIVFWVLIVLGAVILYQFFSRTSGKGPTAIDYATLIQKIRSGDVSELKVRSSEVLATTKDGTYKTELALEPMRAEVMKVATEKKDDSGSLRVPKVEEETSSGFGVVFNYILLYLPLLLILGVWIFMLRQVQSGGNKALSFGKSRAKLLNTQQKRVTFKDVAGVSEAKEELQEIIEFLKEPQKFQKLGGRIPKGVLMVGPPGTGKCITGDSLILTQKGLMEIQDVPKYFWVNPETNEVAGAYLPTVDLATVKDTQKPASHWYNLGEQPTLRVTLKQGMTLEGTPEHPIVVMNKDGKLEFRRLDQLEEGDSVAVKFNSQVFGHLRTVDAEKAYLMGLLTGDGNMSISNRVALTSVDEEINAFFRSHIRQRYGAEQHIGIGTDGITSVVSSWKIKKDLLGAGMSALLANDKQIPDTILQAPKETVVAFLQGLFDADGYFQRYTFGYSTVSKKLAQQVTTLLLNLGVVPRLHIKNEVSETHPQAVYEVTVSGATLPIFAREVGFRLTRKQQLLNDCLTQTHADNACNAGISECWQDAGLVFSPVTDIAHGWAEVFDFTVPETHSFLSNGIISHNTLLARAVAGEANVPFFSISGSDFVEMFVGVGASVTGDTPILVKADGTTKLMPIGEFVDRYYQGDAEGFTVSVDGVQTLGFAELDTKFKGSSKTFVKGSAWTKVQGVYRHRVSEIYEVRYLGGTVRMTADHSVFIRTRDGIKAIAARDLKAGDKLVNLPFKVRGEYSAATGTPHFVRGHEFQPLAENMFLNIAEHEAATADKYAFALAQQGAMSQKAIGAAVGVAQATVGNWQMGRFQPRALSTNYTTTEFPERVPVTPALLKLFGYYTAEGRENGCVEFTFGTHETALHADCNALMFEVFGLTPTITHTADNSTKLTFYSAPVGRFFARHCGKGSKNKHIPSILWDLPRDYFLAYLEGYTLGDGYTTKEGKLSATSASHQLIQELAWLCALHGIKAGIRQGTQTGGRVLKNKPLPEGTYWNLIIGKTSHPFANDGSQTPQGKHAIVQEVTVKPFDGYVYDLCGCDHEAFFGGEKPILLHNSRVRDLFEQGKKNAPCIIFIDEIDAVGRHRGAGLGGGHDEREQTLNQLLVEMDGFESSDGVIIMASTNRPDVLDPALLRPGRFDRRVMVSRPDVKGREGILKVHTRKIPLGDDVEIGVVARGTPGFTGADLANLVNEAALNAARYNKKVVSMADFELAKDKVLMGPERRSMVISEAEKKVTAYHEAGHTLVGLKVPNADPVHKVTIIPRGMALGLTQQLPEGDRHSYTKDYLLGQIAILMGGRIAEDVFLSSITTGASNDIERATELARSMVCEYGMSELGPLTFGKKEEQIFLGREISQHRDYSEDTAIRIDAQVKKIIEGQYERAYRIITENRAIMENLTHALLERETLDGVQIRRIVAGLPLDGDDEEPSNPTTGRRLPEAKEPTANSLKQPILPPITGPAAA